MRGLCIGMALAMVALLSPAYAVQINWADWTSAQVGYPGVAAGTLVSNGKSNNVRYSGEVQWAQTNGGGTNWWTQGNPAPYTGNNVIDNAPPGTDIVVVNQGYIKNTITFEDALLNPVMAFVSIGTPNLGVNYAFDQSFVLLSEGQGWWGDGRWAQNGNVLTGWEAHGAIQFTGLVKEISWINTPSEYWHGFTVGAPAPVPEPSTLLLLCAGVGGLALWRRKSR